MSFFLLLWLAGLALSAEGRVEGVVFDASGMPLPGVEVMIGDQTAATDADGSFAASVEEGTWTVTLTPQENRAGSVAEVVVVEGQSTELLVTLSADGSVTAIGEQPLERTEPTPETTGIPAVLNGQVRDQDGQPVVGARVFVRGMVGEVRTDTEGRYQLALTVGAWDVTVLKSGFATATRSAVPVVQEDGTPLNITLLPAGLLLDDYTVRAPAIVGGTADLLTERRDSASVSDVLGAEQMAKSGDASAASALKRVTGLTVVGGKYVYVRGLGERYSSTLLNGANLPSPEPERRVVPLDMFPSGVLDSIVIQKTFSPDMPAEFGGGTIQLRTRRVPAEPFFKVGTSGRWWSGSTGQQGLSGTGGPTDWLGFDGGYRGLPADVQVASDNEPLEESDMFSDAGYTPEQLESFGEAMPQRWNIGTRTVPLDKGLSMSGGTRLELGRHRLGLLAGGAYADEWDLGTFHQDFTGVGAADALVVKHKYDFEGLERRVKVGGLVTAAWQLGEAHEVTGLVLLSRISDDEARVYSGYNDDAATDIQVSRLRWIERQLLTRQLLGHHQLFGDNGLTLDWRYTASRADRVEPDRLETRFDYEENKDIWLLSDRPEGNQRLFSDLIDLVTDVGVDLKKTVRLGERRDLRLGLGTVVMRKKRGVDTRRFKYMHKGERSRFDDVRSQVDDPNQIFSPENIGSDGFQFEEITRETDNYVAFQNLDAVYGLVDLDLTQSTRVMTGARLERSSQVVQTYQLFNPESVPVNAEVRTSDVLPALTVTQALPAEMQLRAGYGRTVSRPDFREMSPATFNDVTGGRQTFGNPDLLRATIDNYDLRWEFYPTDGESLSVAAFAKQFTNPIEQIVIVSAQHSVTYANAAGADNLGLELDWRKGLGFIHEGLQDVYFTANLALIQSQMRLGEATADSIQTNTERALQGQSPYVLNLQLAYEHPEGRQNAMLMFNTFGRRIMDVGALGAPDTYEESYNSLDFVANTQLPAGFGLSLKGKQLTQPVLRQTQGDLVVREERLNWGVGLGLTWSAGS